MSSQSAKRVTTQPQELPLHISKEKCTGCTYIVTGANISLGLAAAHNLVANGAQKVIMAVRNIEAGEAGRADIEANTGTKGVAEVWELDLSSYASVQAFAKKALTLERIDALIQNAGVASQGATKPEGHHLPIMVNVMGTFLLALLLLPKLRADATKFSNLPHVTIISSGTALDLEQDYAPYKEDPVAKIDADANVGMKVYPLSKLLEILAVRSLARELPLSRGHVVINVVDPGLCITELSRNAPQAFREHLFGLHKQFGRTADMGSRTLLSGAVAGEESHGKFMESCDVAWKSIAKELDTVVPGCVAAALQ
ncbi:NAD(P)-binding protein [Thozetella sp. PMI_491]|nr:NAD(P)-binding protein [Thozetella sp. PMI_491]